MSYIDMNQPWFYMCSPSRHHISWPLHIPSVIAHTLWTVLLSESEQLYLLPIAVSLTEFFCNETSRT